MIEKHEQVEDFPKEFINLRNVIKSKSPSMAKLLPGFVLSYLRNIIHEKQLNDVIYRYRNKFGLDFVDSILKEFGVTIETKGLENIPSGNKFIIAANHPLGGLDGMALMSTIGKKNPNIVFPVNDLLLNLPNLKELFIPINKHGRNTSNIAIFEQTFASEKIVLYFPAGLCSRKIHGKIVDLEWKKTFISKARKYQRDIIPVHISGRNSNFFYNLANLRKIVGIKANIEMLYLVDEMMKQKDKKIKIYIGKPISYEIFTKKYADNKWAEMVKSHIYNIEKNITIDFAKTFNLTID